MIGEWIRFGVTALCVVGGLFALLTALLGLFRFDYALNRLHAAAIADTLALGLVLLGVMVAVGFRAVLWKLVLVLVIQWYTSPCPAICWRNSSTGPGRRIWPAIWSCRRRRRR
ncbi:MAG: monovalent cation/H(+) antiporter subunit G [Oscillospiraceae bacterium]